MSNICQNLHILLSDFTKFEFPFDRILIPKNGIYILFEKGESAHQTDRIVRIGTHTGENQLPSRLEQHFIRENKDRSIFRKNIGRAILNRNNDPFLEQWDIDLTANETKKKYEGTIDKQKLQEVERMVTDYIQHNFRFVFFSVEEKIKRLHLESKIISTVSWCNECDPSENWLGLHSPKEKIRESGLWLIHELYKEPLSEIEYEALKNRYFIE